MTNEELLAKIKTEIEKQIKDPQEHCYGVSSVNKLRELLSFLDTIESEKPMNQDGLEEELDRFIASGKSVTVENCGTYKVSYHDFKKVASHFYELGCRRTAEKYDEIEYNRQREEEDTPNDLEEVAEKHSADFDSTIWYVLESSNQKTIWKREHKETFIDGAKWQKKQDEKEQADLYTIVALDAAQRAKEQMMNDGLDAIKSGQSDKIEKTIAGVFVKYGMDCQKELMLKEAIEGTIYGNGEYTWVAGDIPSQFKYGDKVKIIIVKEEKNEKSD